MQQYLNKEETSIDSSQIVFTSESEALIDAKHSSDEDNDDDFFEDESSADSDDTQDQDEDSHNLSVWNSAR